MESKKDKNNIEKINWKEYKNAFVNQQSSLDSREGFIPFNEYESDLHTMTMKESTAKNFLHSPEYRQIFDEMRIFDQTNLDYFKYEKDLSIGEFDD
ncbi:MAG: hypothetical protein PHS54_04850 [Clostridia bacterium]|nr:hypothetical protein [Clostridia bacterium]